MEQSHSQTLGLMDGMEQSNIQTLELTEKDTARTIECVKLTKAETLERIDKAEARIDKVAKACEENKINMEEKLLQELEAVRAEIASATEKALKPATAKIIIVT